MRFFMDSEFLENGSLIDPVSLAIVTEDPGGPEFYVEFDESRWRQGPNEFVAEHVIPHLAWPLDVKVTARAAGHMVLDYFGRTMIDELPGVEPEIWAYYADYDWVLFCQLFGRMVDLPSWMPKWCRDLKQLAWHLGLSSDDLPAHDTAKHGPQHNALADARRNRDSFLHMQVVVDDVSTSWRLVT